MLNSICSHDQQPRSIEHHLIQANKALLDTIHLLDAQIIGVSTIWDEENRTIIKGAVLMALDELGSLAEWTSTPGFQDEHHEHTP